MCCRNNSAMSAARLAASSVNGELYPESVSSLNVPWPTFALALQSTAVAEVNGFIEKELGLGGGKADSDPKYRKVTPHDGTGPTKPATRSPSTWTTCLNWRTSSSSSSSGLRV